MSNNSKDFIIIVLTMTLMLCVIIAAMALCEKYIDARV